ncbi:AraC family transcriptional regulator [Cohnella ginsengisoli]|uniref:AraC family transcriptional regulator n=1 Tax=Cohnella ginsengisoli TaxID=425004 RepID=A0A9X4QML3_9BACL|nr:AraC family transcriptional regulator [Cohnella ginsengisoli]MDG0791823.1 AraC family transcriptional regulator [Cohnella ginsengisoli]
MFRRRSIRSVLFVAYSVIIALILTISLLLFYLWSSDTLRKQAADSISGTSLSVKEKLDLEIQKMDTVSQNILYSNLVKERFLKFSGKSEESGSSAEDIANTKELAEILVAANGPAMPVQQVNLYDFQGNMFGSGFDNRRTAVSLVTMPWYKEVVANEKGKVITIPERDEQLTHVLPTQEDAYSISLLRLFMDRYNTPEGIVEVKQSVVNLFKTIVQSRQEGVIVYNEQGELIYPAGPGHEAESAYVRQFRERPGGGSIVNPATGERELFAIAHSEFTGWNSAVILSEKSLFTPLRTFTKAFIAFSVGILLFALLLTFVAAQRITKPIARMHALIKSTNLDSIASPTPVELTSGLNELDRLQLAFVKMGERLKYSMDELLLAQQQELQAKMLALQSQMNPHFLYNTLATIGVMAEENMNREIVGMIENLSDLLRYISSDGDSLVDLETELTHTEKFLRCIGFRYGSRLSFALDADKALGQVQVPKLIVQPLVENAVKYGTKGVPPWQIRIRTYAEGAMWYAEVRDNGPGFGENARLRLGEAVERINQTGRAPEPGSWRHGAAERLYPAENAVRRKNDVPHRRCARRRRDRDDRRNVDNGRKRNMEQQPVIIRTVVAEDEELILQNLVKKIQAADPAFQVVGTALDGAEALDWLARTPVDLLFTDIQMPILDGREVIRVAHLKFPHVHKVVISGYNEFEYARHALQHEVVDYLLKPVKTGELELVLAKIKMKVQQERGERNAAKVTTLDNHAYTPEEIVQSVQQFLKDNFDRDLNLEDISRQFNFNPSYLTKIFIKYMGEPPSKYVITLRIQEAKRLLAGEPDWTVKQIGERVGYPDPYYFSRIFKQVTGLTPSEYRSR